MISYAQNHEDVLLDRIFSSSESGRYIDVGAGHPVQDSVTKHFYDRGWRGINIEPEPKAYRALCKQRPGDVNLDVAISRTAGSAVLWIAPQEFQGLSTLLEPLVAKYQGEGLDFRPVEVKASTLEDIFDDYPGPVQFLKIDVEGGELDVLAGADWKRHRPRVIVVEATQPNSREQSHRDWEYILLDAGYRVALFDGLNRFYVEVQDDEAYEILSVPVNVLDNAEPYRWVHHVEEIDKQRSSAIRRARSYEERTIRLREIADEASRAARQLEAQLSLELERLEAQRAALQSERDAAQVALDAAQAERDAAQVALDALEAERDTAQAELESLRRSKSYRIGNALMKPAKRIREMVTMPSQ